MILRSARRRRLPRGAVTVGGPRGYHNAGVDGSKLAAARLTATQRELVQRSSRDHVGVVGGFATGKSTAAAERLLWLDGLQAGRRVLALSGRSTDQAALVRYVDQSTTFHAMERCGHRVAGMMEWTQHTMEELGFSPDGKRTLSFGQLTAFLMHHAHALPLRVFHQRLATASSMQLRRSVGDMLRFFTMLEAHGVYPDVYELHASTRAAETGDEDHMELARAYRVYRELQHRHDVRSWDGLVLDLQQLFENDPHCLSAATNEFTDVVVDDLDRMTPAMVHTLSLILQQHHIQSSMSFSHILVDGTTNPRTAQLHRLLASLNPESIVMATEGIDTAPPSRDRSNVRRVATRVLSSGSGSESGDKSSELAANVTSLEFDSFEDEATSLAALIKQRQSASPSGGITVLCPNKADVAFVSRVFLANGLRVNGRVDAVCSKRRHLFDEPGVDALFSLLVALWLPSDTKHLYNVLRSEFFGFPARVLSRLMEKQHRRSSHATLLEVLTEFADLHGQGLREVEDAELVTALHAATTFLATVHECRHQCHSKSVSELVQLFLERTGHLNRLLEPQTPRDARQAIALAAFLREIDAAQRIVQSVHVPFIVPYLLQLHTARVVTIGDDDEESERGDGQADSCLRDVHVLPLAQFDVDQHDAMKQVANSGGSEEGLVVLMGMRDSKFPGRLKRITWPLPVELLSQPLPVQTRAEFLVGAEKLVYDTLVQLNPKELVVSYAKSGIGGSSKRPEKLSRVLEPLWTTPSTSPAPERSELPPVPQSDPLPPSKAADTLTAPVSPLAEASTGYDPPHLSYSQIAEYGRCPHQYYLSRVLGLRDLSRSEEAPNLAMMFGSTVHEAVAAFSVAVQQGESVDAAESTAFSTLRREWRRDGFLSTEQEQFFFVRAEATLRGWLKSHVPANEIVAVEQEFECRLGRNGDVALRGVWDRIDRTADGKVIIREFKTNPSAQRRANLDAAAAQSLQLQIYLVAYEQLYGETPHGATLEVLGDDHVAAGFVTFSPELRERVDEAVDSTRDAIRRGEFPAKPGFMECAMCSYASSACRANVADGDEDQEVVVLP